MKRFWIAVFAVIANTLLLSCASYALSGTIDITGQKVVDGGEVSEGEYTFELRKPGSSEVIMTTTNRADGSIVFEDVPYSDADIKNEKYIIFEITEVPGDDDTIIYDNNVGYAIITIEESAAEPITIVYAKPVSMEIQYDGIEGNVFHASDDDLQGVAYAVFDSRDGSLTFFRAEEGAYENRHYEYLNPNNYNDGYLYYEVVPENGEGGFNVHQDASGQYYGGGYSKDYYVKSVHFKDAVRPVRISFYGFSNCESYDLRKLDTSRMTSMSRMFGSYQAAKSYNISTFDTSNVTDMSYMFAYDENLERVIFGNPDTTNVTTMYGMFDNAPIESFDFSLFETDSLEHADDMFSIDSVTPIALKRIDMSTWKTNGEYYGWGDEENHYNTQSMFYRFDGDFLDITNLHKVYSAEFTSLYNVRVVKLCSSDDVGSQVLPTKPVINVETGEVIYSTSGRIPYGTKVCGTYATMYDESMSFVNYKKTQLTVKKVDENGQALTGANLSLRMDGSQIYGWETDGQDKFFSNLMRGHDYEIVELDAPEGYRIMEPVSFTIDDNGTILRDGEEVSEIVVKNEKDIVKAKKIWDDDGKEQYRPDEVHFNLVNARTGDIVDTITLTEADADTDGNWVGEFAVSGRYEISGFENSYRVVEADNYTNYDVEYTSLEDNSSSNAPIVSNDIEITNTFSGNTFDFDFYKKWNDKGSESERPESITVKIYEKNNMDKALAEVTLTSDDLKEGSDTIWQGTFEDMPKKNNAGEDAEYVIVEDGVENYLASYAYDEGEGLVDILEISCYAPSSAHDDPSFSIYDISDDEAETMHYAGTRLRNNIPFRVRLDGSKYVVMTASIESCDLQILRDKESTIDIDTLPASAPRSGFDAYIESIIQQGAATRYDMTRDDTIAVSSGAMGVVMINKAEFVPESETGGKAEPFAGANMIINTYAPEEPEEPEEPGTPNTLDNIVTYTIIFGSALAFGFTVKRYSQTH